MSFGGFGVGMGGGMPNGKKTAPPSDNQSEQGFQAEQRPQGGGMMNSGKLLSDSAINFSIYEPVSGTSLSERPLLNALLSDEALLAQYEAYLEEIATEILTEENVASITSKLGDLLEPYIDEDPSKFSTTEEFVEGVSGENSLPEFAKQRSESILAQLSGELLVESNETSSMPPGMNGPTDSPNANGEQPQNGNAPQMDGGMRGGFDITSMTDEEFEQFVERIQSDKFPITLPDDFDTMALEAKKAYLVEQMETMSMRGPGGANGGNENRPKMKTDTGNSEDTTGKFTNTDVFYLLGFLALALVAILLIRRIRK